MGLKRQLGARIGTSLLVGSLVTFVLMLTISLVDLNAQKNSIEYWGSFSLRDPDPNYCEAQWSNYTLQTTNTTVLNGTNSQQTNTTVTNETYRFTRERVNSLTALMFALPTMMYLIFFFYDLKGDPMTVMWQYKWYSLVLFFIGAFHVAGTFLNHACSCNVGLILDNAGAWTLLGAIVIFDFFARSSSKSQSRWWAWLLVYVLYVGLVCVLAVLNLPIWFQSSMFGVLIGLRILSGLILIFKSKQSKGFNYLFYTAIPLVIIGLVMAVIDSPVCSDKFKFGTHFIYHIIVSIFVLILDYLFQWSISKDPAVTPTFELE